MATTTNYGWTTPDDTALVKDGASAIRTLGTSVDTTTKNLNPSTTLGDIEYRSSTSNTNTRLGIGSSGQVLTVAAGVPSWATASDQTPLTTKGDLFTFSTLDARIGVGANNSVLTADSAEATGLKWATPAGSTKSYSLLSTTTLNGASSYTVSSLSGYDNFKILVTGVSYARTIGGGALRFRLAGDTASNYGQARLDFTFTSTYNYNEFAPSAFSTDTYFDTASNSAANQVGFINVDLAGCNTTGVKTMNMQSGFGAGNYNQTVYYQLKSGIWSNSSVVSSIQILTASGDNFSAGTMRIYGAA